MTDTTLSCAMCGGAGQIQTQRQSLARCPNCQGLGLVTAWGRERWSWLTMIDDGTILERRMEMMVRNLLNGLLFVFSLLGLALGARDILTSIETRTVGETFVSRSWPMAAFWFGVLAACYLGFRWYRQATNRPKIPLVLEEAPAPTDWAGRTEDLWLILSTETMTVFERAWQRASHDGDRWLTPAHLLLAMSDTPMIGSMLVRMGINPSNLQEHLAQLSPAEHAPGAAALPNAASQTLLHQAFLGAARAGQPRIEVSNLLAAFGQLQDQTRELLYDFAIDDERLTQAVAWLQIQDDLRHRLRRYQSRAAFKPKGAIDRGYTAAATPVLNRYSSDLTLQAKDGRLPYIVGREAEMKTMFRIIQSNRRSVMVIGDSGVGKTSLLEALAERMVAEDVPEPLQDKRLVHLSAASLVAGTGGAGQLEARINAILMEISRAGNIVLAIENFDQLVGASTAGSEGLDAAQIIADAAAKRIVIVVATATPSAYRKYLERGVIPTAFEKLELSEMEPEEAIRVLQSRVGPLEHRYNVFFTFAALDKAVNLARRYLRQQTLPGSALDLLEESAVGARQSGGQGLVTEETVAKIVSERTKVAVTEVTQTEQTKLLQLESLMHERVVGQDEAVSAVSDALRRARTELRDPRRPISNLLFLGPTGVGKTELAKTVAEVFFQSEDNMIRLDMSEYQEVNSINRLIGAPAAPGLDGGGGFLTDAVREHPYSLVLLDELEKAHPDILNVFLQVMDDGRLTDAAGRTIDFTNSIIIATSNAGTQHIQNRLLDGAALSQIKTELLQDVLQKYFRPEFLNRFDAIILFTPLSQDEVERIVGLMVGQIAKRLESKGIALRATPEAIRELAAIGFDPLFGARPLRRAVQDHVDNALAKFLLEGKISRRDVAVLDAGSTIRVEKAAPIGS